MNTRGFTPFVCHSKTTCCTCAPEATSLSSFGVHWSKFFRTVTSSPSEGPVLLPGAGVACLAPNENVRAVNASRCRGSVPPQRRPSTDTNIVFAALTCAPQNVTMLPSKSSAFATDGILMIVNSTQKTAGAASNDGSRRDAVEGLNSLLSRVHTEAPLPVRSVNSQLH